MIRMQQLPQERRQVTDIPGPRSLELLRRRRRAVPDAVYEVVPIFVNRASGSIIEDVDGNLLIDFASGIGVLNAGNGNWRVIDAAVEQAKRYMHTCFHVAMNEPYVAVAERLNAIAPGDGEKLTFLVNSGAEAVENAVRLARYFTKRPGIVTFDHGYHGRSELTSALSAGVMPWKHGFGASPAPVYRLPFAYPYRCPLGKESDACGSACADYAIDQISRTIGPESIACVVMEPVQGVGGGIVPAPEFVVEIADYCRQRGILFVADEVQSAFGRTGRWFGIEHFGVTPDVIATAKALGGGLPIAGVTGRADIMSRVHVGGLGSTLGGNPVACAAALAVLDEISSEGLMQRASHLGNIMTHELRTMRKTFDLIGDIRGLGAMMALELVRDREDKTPAAEETERVVHRCHTKGLVVLRAGSYSNVIRLLPPLSISDGLLREGLSILADAIACG